MAKNTTVGYLKVPANGRLGKAYALGVRQLDKSGWTLRDAYTFSYKIKYQGRSYRAKNVRAVRRSATVRSADNATARKS